MAEKFVLEAQPREIVGKKVKQLRRDGVVPAVVYGRRDPENVQVDMLQTSLALRDADENALFNLQLNGEDRVVLVRGVQRHITRGDLIHLDFYEISMDEIITAEVTINLVGMSGPEEAGEDGRTSQLLYSIEIEAKPNDLISEITADATLIKTTEDTLMVRDLVAPEGVKIMTSDDVAVAKFEYKRDEELVEAAETISMLEGTGFEDLEGEGEEGEEGDEDSLLSSAAEL